MKTHVSKVVSACFYQLRKIRQVRRVVGQDITQHLYCCTALLDGSHIDLAAPYKSRIVLYCIVSTGYRQ